VAYAHGTGSDSERALASDFRNQSRCEPMRTSWLVGWCLTAISAQIAYIMPWMFQIYRLGLEQTRSKETQDKIGPREIHVTRSC